VANPADDSGEAGARRRKLNPRRGGDQLIGRLKDHGCGNYQFRANEKEVGGRDYLKCFSVSRLMFVLEVSSPPSI
jgi:hypothetical protein